MIESLDIHDCPLLTKETLGHINKYGQKLRVLTFGSSASQIFTCKKENKISGPEKLEKLVVWNIEMSINKHSFLQSVTKYSDTLTWLDISGTQNIDCFKFLGSLSQLVGLVLYNVNLKGCDDPSIVKLY